jgi:hypothetical protein
MKNKLHGKNKDLSRTASRLTGRYYGDRAYEQLRYKLAILLDREFIASHDFDGIDLESVERLWAGSGERMP